MVDTINTWYLIEIQGVKPPKAGVFGTGATVYVTGKGFNPTSAFEPRITPLNATAYIGQYHTGIQTFTGYMSEFTIIKGEYRRPPFTYAPTRNIKY